MTTRPRGLRPLGAALLIATLLPAGAGAADRTFAKRFGTNDLGDVAIAGNTLLTCPAHCAAENGVGSGSALNNNGNTMVRVDVDGDATTTSSSMATLTMPAGATVLWAGLYWGADTSAGSGGAAAPSPSDRNKIRFAVPGGSYTTVTSTQDDLIGTRYQSFADVTAAVRAAGAGAYWAANIQAGTGQDRYAGWSLVVAYHDDNGTPHNLTIFDGYKMVNSGGGGNPTETIPVSGFTTAPSGPVNTTLGAITYEGDLGSTGDAMSLDNQPVSDGANAVDNVFNSTISKVGTLVSAGRNPSQSNTFGFDADTFVADGLLGNSATGASMRFVTNPSSGETFFPGVLTFSTQLYAPLVRSATTVTDLNGGATGPGDILEYEITATNTGNDTADGLTVTTDLPAGLEWIPGSLVLVAGPGAGPQSDAAGDDLATWDPVTRKVTWHLGTGATAGGGGSLNVGDAFTARFRVKVAQSANGTSISTPATTEYVGHGTGDPYQVTGSGGTFGVSAPDLALDVKRSAPFTRGARSSYVLTVANVGTAATSGAVTLVNDLPEGVELDGPPAGDGWSCSVAGRRITCSRSDALSSAASFPPVTIPVRIREDAPAVISNTARVSGGGDESPGGDTASEDQIPAGAAAPAAARQEAAPAAPKVVAKCVSRRSFPIRLRIPTGGHATQVSVKLNGKPLAVKRADRLTAMVDLRGRPAGKVTVRISAVTRSGKRLEGTRIYRTCDIKRPSTFRSRL